MNKYRIKEDNKGFTVEGLDDYGDWIACEKNFIGATVIHKTLQEAKDSIDKLVGKKYHYYPN